MGSLFAKLVSELPVNQMSYEFKKPLEIFFRGEKTSFRSYTLSQMTGESEKLILKSYEQGKLNLLEVLSLLLIKVDDIPLSKKEATEIIKEMSFEEYELMAVNLRVMSYGEEVVVSFDCDQMIPKKNEYGQVEKDMNGDSVMVKCDGKNKITLYIGNDVFKKPEDIKFENEIQDFKFSDSVTMRCYIKPMFSTIKEQEVFSKLNEKERRDYYMDVELITALSKVELIDGDGVVADSIIPSISYFLNKNGAFDVSNPNAIEFLNFHKKIGIGISRKIRAISGTLREERSYIDMSYTKKCTKCKQTSSTNGKLVIMDPNFLLPSLDK